MRIVTGTEGSWRTLQILDADPGHRTALEELGFGPDLARRYPPDTRYFDRAVANLTLDLDEMVLRAPVTDACPARVRETGR